MPAFKNHENSLTRVHKTRTYIFNSFNQRAAKSYLLTSSNFSEDLFYILILTRDHIFSSYKYVFFFLL